MADLTPTAVWRIRPEVVVALEEQFGEPVDSYVNGSQVWLFDHGPNDVTFEWRLHPVAGYEPPEGLSTYELWETVAAALIAGADPSTLKLAEDERSLESLWDGLECFPAYDVDGADAVEPATLAARVSELLGIAPDRHGLVDHQRIGTEWEKAQGDVSIVDLLFGQLEV